MKINCNLKPLLAVILAISLFTTACSAQWISIALADLPVLIQMALNIGTLVTSLQSGQPLSPAETAAIQNISSEASKDLNLLQTLYNEYKANPNGTTLQRINDVITTAEQSLPALLQAAHISNPAVLARVTAGVNLILTTVESFATLIPSLSTAQVHAQITVKNVPIAKPAALKKLWNEQVCGNVDCRIK